jgi:hypothetical protein
VAGCRIGELLRRHGRLRAVSLDGLYGRMFDGEDLTPAPGPAGQAGRPRGDEGASDD